MGRAVAPTSFRIRQQDMVAPHLICFIPARVVDFFGAPHETGWGLDKAACEIERYGAAVMFPGEVQQVCGPSQLW